MDKDCCLWDGVECNKNTGHVIGLDLGSSYLYGSFVGKTRVSHTKHSQRKINGSTSFAIDNMYYVNFKIKRVYLGAVKFKTKY